jgi:phage terminase large subunit
VEIELPFRYEPRFYQRHLWSHFVPDAFRKRGVVIAHRRWGKDLLAVNMAACLTQQRIGTYWHVLPFKTQARAVVWNGMDKTGRKFRSYFPKQLIDYTNENEMRIHLKNGSIYQCTGGDDIDRLVGTNPVGVILSEWAIMDPRVDDYLSPILSENDGWSLKITTIRGKNHAYKDLKKAEKLMLNNPLWLGVNQTVDDTFDEDGKPVFGPEKIQAERDAGRSEQLIRQEYYNDPEAPILGAYYVNELMKCKADGRICKIPYDPRLRVSTYWDLGFGDFTVILFVQTYGFEHRVIDCYANSGEVMAHYARVLQEKGYTYDEHYAPWDVEIKDLKSDGKSIYDIARGLGIKFRVTPQPRRVEDGIEQVRNMFPSLWFDGAKCERLLEALSSYCKEPLADNLQAPRRDGADDDDEVMYKDKPKHNWASHYADAVRVMAWNIRKREKDDKPLQTTAVDEFAYV